MAIESKKVVTVYYRVSEPEQGVVEESSREEPLVYLHGHNQMLRGVEDALAGKQVGDKVTVTLAPENAYGPRRDDAVQRISINHVIRAGKKQVRPIPGSVIHVNSKDGPRAVTVIKAGLKTIDVDTNHPFAGMTLTFDLEVIDVRDATPEELEHGHAHGPGGHRH